MDENGYVQPVNKTGSTGQLPDADLALLAILGMGCRDCATRVRNSLISLEGVYDVEIYLHMGMAEVSYDRQQVSSRMMVEAISQAGNDGRHKYIAQLVAIS
jgi:copper chaperone CopZ